jgi:hypothetical protein
MTAHIHSTSDLSSVAPKADESAATASPQAVAAPNSVVAKDHRDAAALVGVSSLDLAGPASVGLALSLDCIGDIDADLEASISALELSWLRCGIIMNHMTLRSCALSEIDASMPSIKPEPAEAVITKANQNIGDTR